MLVEAINIDARSESSENILPRGRCKVKVHVSDVNDNPPQFLKSLYHAIVQIDAKPLAVVKQVKLLLKVGLHIFLLVGFRFVQLTPTSVKTLWYDTL